jgi:hypothetical protein
MPRGGKTRTSGQGRPKGARNKVTAEINAAWDEAIAIAQSTPGFRLADWATRDETSNEKFWLATTKKLKQEQTIDLRQIRDMSDEELEKQAKELGLL